MIEATVFIPEFKNGHRWGFGTYYGQEPRFGSPEDVTLDIAGSAGCPIPKEVIARKGVEVAGYDYAVTNQIFRDSQRLLLRQNPVLFTEIDSQIPRLPRESVGHFEPYAVPKSHIDFVAPKARIYGWAGSRLIRDMVIAKGNQPPSLSSVEDILNQLASSSSTPAEWLVKLANQAMRSGMPVPKISGYILSENHYREEQMNSDFQVIRRAIEVYTPELEAELSSVLH